MRPTTLNILGKTYSILYTDNPSDVDVFKRKIMFGQIDHWSGTIRVFTGTTDDEIFDSIVHEVLHGIVENLRIKGITDSPDYEDIIALLALGLSDFLKRNNWVVDHEREMVKRE